RRRARHPESVPHVRRVARASSTGASLAIVARAATLYAGDACPPGIGPVAQWLEPAAHNGLVGGSNPPGPTSVIDRVRTGLRPPTRFTKPIAELKNLYHQPCNFLGALNIQLVV